MSIADPQARMMEFINDFFERLESIGYGDFKFKNPENTVKLLQSNLHPPNLKTAMNQHFEYQEGLRKNIRKYLNILLKESIVQNKTIEASTASNKDKRQVDKGRKNRHAGGSWTRKNAPYEKQSSVGEKQEPECLNPECHGKHKIKNCPRTSKELAKTLLKQFFDNRQKAAKRIAWESEADDSTRIVGNFSNKVPSIMCTDIGSDINLMSEKTLNKLIEEKADISVHKFERPQRYALAALKTKDGTDVYIECDWKVILTTELQIRHAKSLTVQNMPWIVTSQDIAEPLIGRPTLEALGLDVREVLEAAVDHFNGVVDARTLLAGDEYKTGTVARLLASRIYHSEGGFADDAEAEYREDWLDLGIDTEAEMHEATRNAVRKAMQNGLSPQGGEQLKDLLTEYRDTLRIRLGPDPPANVEPMNLKLKDGAVPFMAKSRRFTSEQRAFIEKYVGKLEEFGFVKINKNATWAATPVVVPKPTSENTALLLICAKSTRTLFL